MAAPRKSSSAAWFIPISTSFEFFPDNERTTVSDFYNPRPGFVSVPIRAGFVDAAEQLAHHEDPLHAGIADAVSVHDAILAEHFATVKGLVPAGEFRDRQAVSRG